MSAVTVTSRQFRGRDAEKSQVVATVFFDVIFPDESQGF